MSRPPRVVVDTSVLVSAALRPGSIPDQALFKALHTCQICVSPQMLDELARVMERKKFDRYLNLELRQSFVALIRRSAYFFEVSDGQVLHIEPASRDSKDHIFLALAAACEAEIVVSSDDDLLVLNPWPDIVIATPEAFLR